MADDIGSPTSPAPGGFFGGLYSVLGPRIKQQQENEQKVKDTQAQFYIDALKSGRLTDPDAIEYAKGQIEKIYGTSKPIKDWLQKAHQAHTQIAGKLPPPPQQSGGGINASGASAVSTAPVSSSPDTEFPPTMALSPDMIPQPPRTAQPAASTASASAAPPMSERVPGVPNMTSAGQTPTLPPPPGFAGIVSAAYPSPDVLAAEALRHKRAETRAIGDIETENRIKIAREQAKAYMARQQPRMGPAISIRNARELAAKGQEYYDENNEPIDLSQIPEGMGLKQVLRGGMTFWVPFSPNQRQVTIGNQVYSVSPMDVQAAVSGGSPSLGVKNPGQTSSREAPAVDANGNPIAQTLNSSRRPAAPGAVQSAPAESAPAPAPVGVPAPPRISHTLPITPAARSSVTAPIPGTRPAAMTPGMYNSQTQRAVPVRNAANQIFGDPSQPDMPSLVSYAPLVDNSDSRQRVGQAMRIVLHEMEGEENKSGRGYLTGLLANYGGLPQALAASQNEVIEDALGQLSPDERDMVDTLLASYGSIVGLRSLTKASASAASVKKLENELPIPGVNVNSSREYANKLSRLAEEVWTGASSLSDQVVPEKQFYKDQVGKLRRMAVGTGTKVPPPPTGGASGGKIVVTPQDMQQAGAR